MSIITTLYFDDNVDINQLYSDLQDITGADGTHRESIDSESKTLSMITPPEVHSEKPGISLLCSLMGKLCDTDTFDGENQQDVECWVEVDIYSRVSQFSLAEMHVAYILGLTERGYSFRWRQHFDKQVYENTDHGSLFAYCEQFEMYLK